MSMFQIKKRDNQARTNPRLVHFAREKGEPRNNARSDLLCSAAAGPPFTKKQTSAKREYESFPDTRTEQKSSAKPKVLLWLPRTTNPDRKKKPNRLQIDRRLVGAGCAQGRVERYRQVPDVAACCQLVEKRKRPFDTRGIASKGHFVVIHKSTPGRIRTYNPRFRRPMLYPIEPRVRLWQRLVQPFLD